MNLLINQVLDEQLNKVVIQIPQPPSAKYQEKTKKTPIISFLQVETQIRKLAGVRRLYSINQHRFIQCRSHSLHLIIVRNRYIRQQESLYIHLERHFPPLLTCQDTLITRQHKCATPSQCKLQCNHPPPFFFSSSL